MTETFVTDCMAAARKAAWKQFSGYRNRDDLVDRVENYAGELAMKAGENATIGSIAWRAIQHVSESRDYRESIRSTTHPLHRTEQRRSKRLRRKRLDQVPQKERLEENPAFIFQVTEDFREYRKTLTKLERRIVDYYLQGYGTGEIAKRVDLSDARVSQIRKDLMLRWRAFTSDEEE